jgi:hypothetical protein
VRTLAAPGPHPSLGDQANLFGQFVGTWDFDCVAWPGDGTIVRFPGEWTFGWVLDGRAVEDVWIGYQKGRDANERGVGVTVRTFDRKTALWRVIYIAPMGGTVVDLRGGARGDRIVLEGKDTDGSAIVWSFNDIKPDSFLWRAETSADGGKTWRTEQEMRLRRRR